MKKKAILRSAWGLPIGITIGQIITILISLIWGKGYYSPCVPQLVDIMGSEISAVVLQTVLCALLGAVFGASSVIWAMERWSIAKQTGIYFLIVSVAMMSVAYFLYWMEHSLAGFLSYFGIFTAIFLLIWLVQYLMAVRNVKKMNSKLKRRG